MSPLSIAYLADSRNFLSSSSWIRFRDLVHELTSQNVSNRYRGSALGVLWSLLNPLTMTIVYVTVFGSLFKKYYAGSPYQYAMSVLIGLLVVTFFSQSTSQALAAVVANAALLQKVRVPFAVFPTSAIAMQVVQFVTAALPLLVLITVFASRNILHIVLLFVPILALFLLAQGVGLLASVAYVYFRDFSYVYDMVLFVLWATSPIFYPVAILPPRARTLLLFNPLYPIMDSLRGLALRSGPPDWLELAAAVSIGAAALALGAGVFRFARRGVMDLL